MGLCGCGENGGENYLHQMDSSLKTNWVKAYTELGVPSFSLISEEEESKKKEKKANHFLYFISQGGQA